MNSIKILDCTLRDGGYVTDWKWGYKKACDIIKMLVQANTDIIEVGFLRNIDGYNPDITVCNSIEELNRLLPDDSQNTMFSAMAMRSNYDINKLSPYNNSGIEMIRITAHDYDIKDGMDFARQVQDKGYKLSINPINIMGYTDSEILCILEEVNKIHPYQFSIVDTFGSMKRRDLDRIVSLVDHNLAPDIRVGLHLHENMALSCSLVQKFIDRNLNRDVVVDASLMGIGRNPGNLPIELIADYLNDYKSLNYEIDYIMDAIQDYIAPIKGESLWGYTPAYFLSARYNLHRNYAEHYLDKGNLTNRDINHLLSRIQYDKKTVFDSDYADMLYKEYLDNRINDQTARIELKQQLENRKILILAPGVTLNTHKEIIDKYIYNHKPVVISVNFDTNNFNIDFSFFSNNKRFDRYDNFTHKLIATSNISSKSIDFYIDYNSLSGAFEQGCNSLIMLLKLLESLDIKEVTLAGADGYKYGEQNYYSTTLRNYEVHDNRFNSSVSSALNKLNLDITFLTPSEYRIG